jgi:hypothetical protein
MALERLFRLRITGAVVVLLALAGCARPTGTGASSPSPTPSRTPEVASANCDKAPPSDRCAARLASHLGFPVLWMPLPSGWTLRQELIGHPGSTVASEDVANGGLDVGMVSHDMSGVPPGMHHAGTTEWQGSRVVLLSGTPDASSYPSGFPAPAWVVSARWTSHGQPYTLGILANPELGPTGTAQDGMKLLLRILRHGVRYANP